MIANEIRVREFHRRIQCLLLAVPRPFGFGPDEGRVPKPLAVEACSGYCLFVTPTKTFQEIGSRGISCAIRHRSYHRDCEEVGAYMIHARISIYRVA